MKRGRTAAAQQPTPRDVRDRARAAQIQGYNAGNEQCACGSRDGTERFVSVECAKCPVCCPAPCYTCKKRVSLLRGMQTRTKRARQQEGSNGSPPAAMPLGHAEHAVAADAAVAGAGAHPGLDGLDSGGYVSGAGDVDYGYDGYDYDDGDYHEPGGGGAVVDETGTAPVGDAASDGDAANGVSRWRTVYESAPDAESAKTKYAAHVTTTQWFNPSAPGVFAPPTGSVLISVCNDWDSSYTLVRRPLTHWSGDAYARVGELCAFAAPTVRIGVAPRSHAGASR